MVEPLSPNKDNNSPTLDPPFNQIKIKLADHFRTGIEFYNKVWSKITQVSRLRGTPTQASVVAHKIRKPTITETRTTALIKNKRIKTAPMLLKP
jgi:hypothetical protein